MELGRSGRVDGQGVQPGLEFRSDRPIYSTMPGDAGKAGEGGRADMDAVMRLARRTGARMAAMQFGFIRDFKLGRCKSCAKCSPHTLRAACQFLPR